MFTLNLNNYKRLAYLVTLHLHRRMKIAKYREKKKEGKTYDGV